MLVIKKKTTTKTNIKCKRKMIYKQKTTPSKKMTLSLQPPLRAHQFMLKKKLGKKMKQAKVPHSTQVWVATPSCPD